MQSIPNRASLVLAAALMLVAAVQEVSMPVVALAWFPFYPVVFLGSWIGGRVVGLVSTALSATLVWVFFLPSGHELIKDDPTHYLSAAIFICTGVLFSVFHERLRAANQRASGTPERSRSINVPEGARPFIVDPERIAVVVGAAPVEEPDGALASASLIPRDIAALKEIERMREEWSALVAHDLQQPMNAILLGLDLILRGQLGARERATSERIRGSAARLSRMICDLNEISTLESRRLSLRRQDVDLSRFAHDVVERCPEVVDRVAIRTPAVPVVVSCDPDRLEQVMTNLLTNAAKYGDDGSEIEIDVERDRTHAKISVSTRGMGIPVDEIDRVFDRYVRTRAARRSTLPGSGLGLYIARGLVEAHGGRIWASSVPGELTSFHVELPAPSDGGVVLAD